MPFVSVIVPNYNHAAYLKQRLDSVLDQTFRDFEVIILDDCSTDCSKEIIEQYRGRKNVAQIVYNESNTGSPFKQWQRGLELATGEYVWIAESDDWASAGFLEVLVHEISTHDNIGICFSGSNWVDDKGNVCQDLSVYQDSFFIEGKEEIKKSLVKYNTIQNASSALIKREAAKDLINKATKFKAAGDWLLYIDILMDFNLLFIGKKLNNFRWYHNNTSNKANISGMWIREGLRVLNDSNSFKLSFGANDRRELTRYWLERPSKLNGFKRFLFELQTHFYLTLFFTKSRFHNSLK